MRITQISGIYFVIVIFISCRTNDYRSSKIISPSKKYYLIVTVNRIDKLKNNYADVVISLYDSNGLFGSTLNTNAGDFNKWSAGWNKMNDTVILYSSDIGNLAWQIKNDKLIPVELNMELNKRAYELEKEKYK